MEASGREPGASASETAAGPEEGELLGRPRACSAEPARPFWASAVAEMPLVVPARAKLRCVGGETAGWAPSKSWCFMIEPVAGHGQQQRLFATRSWPLPQARHRPASQDGHGCQVIAP